MLMTGNAEIAKYSTTPWAISKTGVFIPGAKQGVGTVQWTVTVTRSDAMPGFAVIGFFDLANNMANAVPITSVVVNLQKTIGGSWTTVTSDIADATIGDAATQASVDPDVSVEGLIQFQENAASGSLSFYAVDLSPAVLNSPPASVPAGQTLRQYFVARFDAAELNLTAGTPLQIETIVSFGNNFIMPSLSTVTDLTVPNATPLNASVLLSDSGVTTGGTATADGFTALNRVVTDSGTYLVQVSVNGGSDGGSVCNTATLTSSGGAFSLSIDGQAVPLIQVPGIALSATDCQDIPKPPSGPKLIVSNLTSCSQVVAYDTSLFESPNGPIVSATFNPESGSVFPFGTSTVNFSATDSAGNTTTGTFTVTVSDTEPPVIVPIAPIIVSARSDTCSAKVEFSTAASDCNLQSIAYSPASGSEFPLGTTTVTITATDTAGHQATSTFTVTVKDTTPPALQAPNIVLNSGIGTCGANVTFAATATDCSAATLVYSLNPTFVPALGTGASFPLGTTTVYVKATDAAGNASSTSFTVTVVDVQPPVISVSDIVVNNEAGLCGAHVTFTASASDCTTVTLTYSLSPNFGSLISSGANFPVGTTKVYVRAIDTSGNAATSSFNVKVNDVEPPTITSPLANLALNNDTNQCYATFKYTPAAVDNCGGAVTVTVSPASGSHFAAGTTTIVTVTATDSLGNSVRRTFTVTVAKCPVTQTTYTQGGWGAPPNGSNPGTLLWKYFSTIYPKGLVVGGGYTLTFTSASAVTNALPLTGTPCPLTRSLANPLQGNTFASQTVALKLNVDFSARGLLPTNVASLGTMHLVSGKLAGWSVSQVLSLCNTVLGGKVSALPVGVSVGDLTDIAAAINGNFDNAGTNNGYLVY